MKYVAILLMILGLSACGETQANGSGITNVEQQKALSMIEYVRSDPVLRSYPQSCPAALYKTKSGQSGAVADCAKNPRQCISQCKGGNAKACFDAAQVIEAGYVPDDNLATYPLYTRACALGDGNACVNAGATIKNAVWRGGKPTNASTPKCQFETFSRMCQEGHPWGCYMTALEYKRGGYGGKSDAKYAQHMRKACKISKTSGACEPAFR